MRISSLIVTFPMSSLIRYFLLKAWYFVRSLVLYSRPTDYCSLLILLYHSLLVRFCELIRFNHLSTILFLFDGLHIKVVYYIYVISSIASCVWAKQKKNWKKYVQFLTESHKKSVRMFYYNMVKAGPTTSSRNSFLFLAPLWLRDSALRQHLSTVFRW